jgi:DNA polymerase alpha subunit A
MKSNEPVTFIDLYQEFSDTVANKYRIMKYKSMKVEKEYAFELVDVPAQSEYLEVRYPVSIAF